VIQGLTWTHQIPSFIPENVGRRAGNLRSLSDSSSGYSGAAQSSPPNMGMPNQMTANPQYGRRSQPTSPPSGLGGGSSIPFSQFMQMRQGSPGSSYVPSGGSPFIPGGPGKPCTTTEQCSLCNIRRNSKENLPVLGSMQHGFQCHALWLDQCR
jgi:hypothetical protein